MIKIICPQCGCSVYKETGVVNRSIKYSAPIYCGRKCAGLSRRTTKSKEEKILAKAEYDREYRKSSPILKSRRAEYHKNTYNPEKAAVIRKARMPEHLEYCRSPEYRKWKSNYDKEYRAKKNYGEFAECFLLTQQVRSECLSQASDYQIRQDKSTLGKAQQRKRNYGNLNSNKSEIGPMGNT